MYTNCRICYLILQDNQNPFWNGYKKGWFLAYQGILFPDGMIVVNGPESGHYTDVMVWRDCEVRDTLNTIMAEREAAGQQRLKLYADKLYRTNSLIISAYSLRDGALLPWMTNSNAIMSAIRVGVEWAFGKIIVRAAYSDFSKGQRLQESAVAKYYYVAVLLCNIHTCMNGSVHTKHFNCVPPTVEDYLG